MRVFVFLLILANLVFLAWTQGYLGAPANPDSLRVQQQLLADQVKVVSRSSPPEVSVPAGKSDAAETARAADACLALGEVSIAQIARIEGMLAEKLPAFKAERTAVSGGSSYWVNIPPLTNKKEADAKTAELKKLNVSDFFVVQEEGPNNRAISLGLFSTKTAAASRLDALSRKGVRSARITERIAKPALATVEIRGPDAQTEALRQSLAEILPEGKPADCKAQAAAAQ